MSVIEKYNYILTLLNSFQKKTKLIVVTKNQDLDKINIIIKQGHRDFGENRVQEAVVKWANLLSHNENLNLHLIGKLQSNKANEAFNIFKYIHTLDNEKLAKLFNRFENDGKRKIKYFIQVNIGNEIQKNGISDSSLTEFIRYCKFDLKLDVIGLMCIPPVSSDSSFYFQALSKLALDNNLKELSMGMSNDYISAIKNGSTFIRIGSGIFGERFN
jgi:pyridoxal phosphate enzyme (YggS family)